MSLSIDFASLAIFTEECYFNNATMDMARSDEQEPEPGLKPERGVDENGGTEKRDEEAATRPCIALEFDGLHCFETIVSH
ncbi:hypothetical protein ACJRO7_003632 [Eucalyptus globulus]|uniref:Uncharacterized protein n=1 Tax=Eucalyptus globulus TaxID=34317 RepID=A0ABD3IXC9_EUCGL